MVARERSQTAGEINAAVHVTRGRAEGITHALYSYEVAIFIQSVTSSMVTALFLQSMNRQATFSSETGTLT